jgi:hypothetical protein
MLVPISDLGRCVRVGWMDGSVDGTLWFELDDAEGQCAVVCFDSREESRTRSRLFEGARHPAKPGAVLLELGSSEEGIVVPALSAWLDSEEARERIRPAAIERAIQYLLRLGEPEVGRVSEPGGSAKE